MKLVSFDIFDTTLIRKCGRASNIFELLAYRLFPDDRALREAFLFWRQFLAEKMAHKDKTMAEVSIEDIYHTIDKTFLNTYTYEQLIQAEKDIESENLIANPRVRKLIAEKRKEGFTIAFISDMYLDSKFLRSILIREDCAIKEDKIYISCEYNARKDSGLLYENIRQELNPSEWKHYGDNLVSDVKKAREKGIQAFKVYTEYTQAESSLEKRQRLLYENRLSVLVGFSRTHRLMENNNPFAAMAADFVAPAYIPYAVFIMQQARRANIRKLYFLSRDSYTLMRTVQSIHALYKEVELRYLFVSRRSLCLPYLAGGSINEYLEIIDQHTLLRKNVDSLLKQLGTSRKELMDKYSISFHYTKIENKEQEQDFLHRIFDSQFTFLLQQRAHEQERIVISYFEQEGLMDESVESAAVDIGWLGTSRLMINSLLRRHGAKDLTFFYYGIRKDVYPISYGKYFAYFQPEQLSTSATGLIENYFSASPYPTTVGYLKNESGKISPVFPYGEEYKMTSIVMANTKALEYISKEIIRFHDFDERLLFLWAKYSLDILTLSTVAIDMTPFLSSADFDDKSFVKRLNISELFSLLLSGKQVTAFDWASLRVTLPRFCWKLAWKTRELAGKLRAYLFRKIYNTKAGRR